MRLFDEYVEENGPVSTWSRSKEEVVARGAYSALESDRQAALELVNAQLAADNDRFGWQIYRQIRFGNIERAYQILEDRPSLFSEFASDFMWLPLKRSIEFRQHPDFPALLERNGFVEAWQDIGWPDLCRPNPGTNGSNGQFSCS